MGRVSKHGHLRVLHDWVYNTSLVSIDWGPSDKNIERELVTKLPGKVTVPNPPFGDYDGSPLVIDTDYYGKKRDLKNPSSGPFEISESNRLTQLEHSGRIVKICKSTTC